MSILLRFPELFALLWCFIVFSSLPTQAIEGDCSYLSGWEGTEAVSKLTTRISQVLAAEATTSGLRYRTPCQRAVAHIIIAYEAVKELARKDYQRYRERTVSAHFHEHPWHNKFSFLSRFILNGQVQQTWQEYKRLSAAQDPATDATKARLLRFILNKYRSLARDQRRLLPEGPIIIPLARAECPWRSMASRVEALAFEGREVPSGSYCVQRGLGHLDSDPYSYQRKASTIGFEISGNQIIVSYCEQENSVATQTSEWLIFHSTSHVVTSHFKCVTYDLASTSYLPSDASEMNLRSENIDELENNYQALLRDNPNLPNKVLEKDEWWRQQKAAGHAPTFASFFSTHYPATCPTFGSNFTVRSEEEAELDRHPAFWHYDDVGLSR